MQETHDENRASRGPTLDKQIVRFDMVCTWGITPPSTPPMSELRTPMLSDKVQSLSMHAMNSRTEAASTFLSTG